MRGLVGGRQDRRPTATSDKCGRSHAIVRALPGSYSRRAPVRTMDLVRRRRPFDSPSCVAAHLVSCAPSPHAGTYSGEEDTMATVITTECINCGACETEYPSCHASGLHEESDTPSAAGAGDVQVPDLRQRRDGRGSSRTTSRSAMAWARRVAVTAGARKAVTRNQPALSRRSASRVAIDWSMASRARVHGGLPLLPARCDEGQLLSSGEGFQGCLPAQRRPSIARVLLVRESHRKPRPCVACAAPCRVALDPPSEIVRGPGVERSVPAAKDVDAPG